MNRRGWSLVALLSLVGPRALADGPRAVSRAGVCMQPLAPYDAGLLADAGAGIRYLYGLPVTVLPARPLPAAAYYPPRKRYRADRLLDYLDAEVAPRMPCAIVVGFTKVDISTTKGERVDWGILGLARIGGPSAVVSSFRARRGVKRRRIRERVVKVANHELGHALGVPHQPGQGCLMNDAGGTVRTVDAETGLLCEPARRIIQTRHHIALPSRGSFDWRAVLGSRTGRPSVRNR